MFPAGSSFAPIGKVIKELVEKGNLKRLELYKVFEIWSEVVGPNIAKNARPCSINGDVLIVSVVDVAWMSELQFMKSQILESIHRRMGTSKIADIRFKLD